eukprot:scaffold120446_cov16-Tisochrysis_lutea.AAC.2
MEWMKIDRNNESRQRLGRLGDISQGNVPEYRHCLRPCEEAVQVRSIFVGKKRKERYYKAVPACKGSLGVVIPREDLPQHGRMPPYLVSQSCCPDTTYWPSDIRTCEAPSLCSWLHLCTEVPPHLELLSAVGDPAFSSKRTCRSAVESGDAEHALHSACKLNVGCPP